MLKNFGKTGKGAFAEGYVSGTASCTPVSIGHDLFILFSKRALFAAPLQLKGPGQQYLSGTLGLPCRIQLPAVKH